MPTKQELKILQALDYKTKIRKAELRIKEWVEHWGVDNVAVSVSGGLDSMALLHLVRSLYPGVRAVGVPSAECKENQKVIEQLDNYIPLKSEYSKIEIIKKFGFPIGSKKIAKSIRRLQHPSPKNLKSNTFALTGVKSNCTYQAKGKLGKCWLKLVNKEILKELITDRINYFKELDINEFKYSTNPNKAIAKDEVIRELHKILDYANSLENQINVNISEQCCYYTKEKPMIDYGKKYDIHYFVGEKASDGDTRETSYLGTGCNCFKDDGKSKPFGPCMHQDILIYTVLNMDLMSEKYGDIVEVDTRLKADREKIQWLVDNYKPIPELTTTKASRTGCFICAMGLQMEKQPNRFQRMEIEDPGLYDFAINRVSYGPLLDYMNMPYRMDQMPKRIEFGEQISVLDIIEQPTKEKLNLVYKDKFDGKAKHHEFNTETDLQNFISHNQIEVVGWR